MCVLHFHLHIGDIAIILERMLRVVGLLVLLVI